MIRFVILNFVYSGSFTIETSLSATPISSCGWSSTDAGLEVTSINNASQSSFNVSFDIQTNIDGTFNSSLNLCFVDQLGVQYCYDININLTDPCNPDDDNCEIDVPPFTIECTSVEDGVATYLISYSFHSPELIAQGFDFCEDGRIMGEDVISDTPTFEFPDRDDIILEPHIGIGAYIFGIEIEIDCEDLRDDPSTEVILNLCNESEQICVDIDFSLECDPCQEEGNRGRSQIDERDEFVVFPNPTSDIFTINTPDNDNFKSYKLYDISSKEIMAGLLINGNNIINFDGQEGLYLLKLIDGEEVTTKRIIKIK